MIAACACGGAAADAAPEAAPERCDVLLHLPDIHCASCIASAEDALSRVPGVRSARVNLSLKRAFVETTDPDAAPLIGALSEAGIAAQELDPGLVAQGRDRVGADLLMRLGVAGFAMMNVMLLSVAVWSGASASTERLFHLISALITVPTVVYAGRPFFSGAWQSIRAGRMGMDMPISLGILMATIMSLRLALVGDEGHAWFDAALSLTFFLLVGRYLDHRGRAAARSAAQALAALDVPRALRLGASGQETVPTSALRPGDLIRVLPGMRVPADGQVTEGRSDIDRSAMTGESEPDVADVGSEVLAGETVLTGALTVRVTHAGRDTTLSRMIDLVAQAEEARGAYLSIADRVVRHYVPIVHLLALAALAWWWWQSGDFWHAAGIAVAVLIITCPCALGLAVPAASVAATGRLFRAGLLVKAATALERLAEVDTVVFDKTGTLTTGRPDVVDRPEDAVFAVALGLARQSNHPAAQAIVSAGAACGIDPAPVTEVSEVPGQGVSGRWNGQAVSLGRGAAQDGQSTSWLRIGDRSWPIRFREHLRPGAAETVAALQAKGLRVLMLSGDAEGPVTQIASALGISEARHGLLPQDKVAVLDELAAQGARVLMVGDGLNDTAALSRALVAMSPGSALDAPRSAADVVMLGDRMDAVPLALDVARRSRRRMRENLGIALAYNLVAVPIAFAGLATPLIAALAMSASSVTVSLNAARLAR